MQVHITEYSSKEYPDNPATLSKQYGQYSYRDLKLEKLEESYFTLTFLPANPISAKIRIKNIDVGLMTPSIPAWIQKNPNLIRIALTDRQWNRQQVLFQPNGPHVEIQGGNGFEKNHTYSVEIAKNCLNAGLWEILLFKKENGKKVLYYHGWFTFPLGYYRQIFEKNTGLSYLRHWYYLEHWVDPENTLINLNKLRKVTSSQNIELQVNFKEQAIARGEQINRKKNIIANKPIQSFADYYKNPVKFSTFLPPGIYRKDKPWSNEYWRIDNPVGAVLHNIVSPAFPSKVLQEIVINYMDKKGKQYRFYLSGFDINQLPRLEITHYNRGNLYLMGIGTPPLKQSYTQLVRYPPDKSPVFSVLLDSHGKWINHHDVGIDGSIIFLDKNHPNHLHFYLVSYERHAVIAHYVLVWV